MPGQWSQASGARSVEPGQWSQVSGARSVEPGQWRSSKKSLTFVDTSYILIARGDNMYTKIQKWGNSQAVRIPKAILEKAELNENDKVEIKVVDGNVTIIPVNKHRTLEERIAEYKGDYDCREWDTDEQKGREVL